MPFDCHAMHHTSLSAKVYATQPGGRARTAANPPPRLARWRMNEDEEQKEETLPDVVVIRHMYYSEHFVLFLGRGCWACYELECVVDA